MLFARLSCSAPDRFRWRYNDPFRRHFFCSQKARPETESCPESRQLFFVLPFCFKVHILDILPAMLSKQDSRLPQRQGSPTRRPASCSSGSGRRRPILGFRGGQLSNCCHYDRSPVVGQLGQLGWTAPPHGDDPATIATAHCHCTATPLHHGNPPP